MALHPTYISLFSGAGGLELAVRLALPESQCVCYVEREVEAAEILATRFADKALDDAPVWSDVSTFDGKPWRGLVDGIAGGFPCQDLSVAGKREGIKRGNRSGLWYQYARIIREVEPRWVYIENVPPVLAFPAGGIVLGELAAMGFDAEWGTLRASDVGASHRRKRCFVLAYRRCEPDERRRIFGELSGAAAGAEGEGYQRKRLRIDSGDGGADVADGGGDGWGESAGEKDAQRASADYVSERVDDTAGPRFRTRLCSAGGEICDGGMVFAPGPASAIWNDVLVRDYGMRPALSQAEAESCLRRVADGMANPLDQRIDRLRACGNGVVPLQGATAFTELMRRAIRK